MFDPFNAQLSLKYTELKLPNRSGLQCQVCVLGFSYPGWPLLTTPDLEENAQAPCGLRAVG